MSSITVIELNSSPEGSPGQGGESNAMIKLGKMNQSPITIDSSPSPVSSPHVPSASPKLNELVANLPSKKRMMTSTPKVPQSSKRRKVGRKLDMRSQVLSRSFSEKLKNLSGVTVTVTAAETEHGLKDNPTNIEPLQIKTVDRVSSLLELSAGEEASDEVSVEEVVSIETTASLPAISVNSEDCMKTIAPGGEEVISKEIESELRKVEDRVVNRSKRKVRVYVFDDNDGEEVVIRRAEKVERVPALLGRRPGTRPFIILPGVKYDDVDGEALNDLEDQKEALKARNEKYLIDSFVFVDGYLSDEEMMETPTSNKVVCKVKQKRKAKTMRDSLFREQLASPEILGPVWDVDKSTKPMKPWKAIVFCQIPILTSFTSTTNVVPGIPEAEKKSGCVEDQKVSEGSKTSEEMSLKYRVKYWVRQLVQDLTKGVAADWSEESLLREVLRAGGPGLAAEPPALVSRYVRQGNTLDRLTKRFEY